MQISDDAREKLQTALRDYGADAFIRVGRMFSGGGACCAGNVSFGITLDEERDEDTDLSLTVEGLPVVIERYLYESVRDASIVYEANRGIVVSGANPSFPAGA
jgi:Fe-S cluster assembly iron-binding protein IscA